MALRFDVSELKKEITVFEDMTKRYLKPGASLLLKEAASQLDYISGRSTDKGINWSIGRDRPIVTRDSIGEYARGAEGALSVEAEISFIWQLLPIREKGKSGRARQVELAGLASTLVRIVDIGQSGTRNEVAAWRMEIADDAAPGTYFHVQVLGRDADVVFPKSLDVPRLPGVLATPFACMEFVIAELFQDGWARDGGVDTGANALWRGIQAYRHTKQLQWHLDEIARTGGSPWLAWKRATPPSDLFLPSARK